MVDELVKRNEEILDVCSKEMRDLNEEEAREYDENIEMIKRFITEETVEVEQRDNKEVEDKEEDKEEEKNEEDVKDEKEEDEEKVDEDDKKEEDKEEVEDKEEDKAQDNKDNSDEDENRNLNLNKNKQHNIMNENFSLTRAICNVIDHKTQDEVSAAVINAGKNELRNAGMNYKADIAIPMEQRAVQVTGEYGTHDALIDTDFMSIQEPLKSKNILTNLGVQVISGLVNDLQIPYGSSISSNWVGETAQVDAADAEFTFKVMKPKRLSTKVLVSMQQLRQDAIGVESYIRKQIVESIQDRLEATVFGNSAATDNRPAGILYKGNCTVGNDAVATFKDLTANEALIEDNNYNGVFKYAVTPKAKAALRAMQYGGKTTAMVMQGNEVDGVPVEVSTHVGQNAEYLYGDFSTIICGQWGPILLQVDDVTLADQGLIRLIINSFWDVCYTRPEAIVSGKISEK